MNSGEKVENMDDKWLVGVDIGGTTIKIAFVTLDGTIVTKWEIPTNKVNHGINIPQDIAKSIEGKLIKFYKGKSDLVGLGVGAPGPVDDRDGSIIVGVNIGWSHFPLKEKLQQVLSLPVTVDNDANVAAIGEMWRGAGEGAKDMICVTLGTGVGGGVISNGEIVHGVNGAAGEIGHMTVVTDHGALCNCGKYGCLETIASATGIVRMANEMIKSTTTPSVLRNIELLTSKTIFEAAQHGDPLAETLVNKVALDLGLSLANVANVTNPQKIVIGGGVSKAGDVLLNPVKKYFQLFAFSRVAEGGEIRIAKLGNDAGVIGAAWLVKQLI